MGAPEQIVAHLHEHGYHPRSNKHGGALCDFVLSDLVLVCPKIASEAQNNRLVFSRYQKIIVGGSEWNIDLVLGPPAAGAVIKSTPLGVGEAVPATIRIAIEAKTVMTKHANARRNRQRDLDSFHQHTHRYDDHVVAAGLTIVNVAERFRSPLNDKTNEHRNVRRLVQETMQLLRQLPLRSTLGSSGLEANGAIVVEHDNIDNARTRLVSEAPAPPPGDPLHYDSFIRRICDRYSQRW